jgi:zinc protease
MTILSSVEVNPSLPGPHDIKRKVLSNGITVLTRSNINSSSVVISGFLSAGSLNDPPDKLGLAHFTSIALMRGTKKSEFQKIFERLESVGASFGFGASVHNTSFSGRALAEDLPLLIETMKECILEPTFPIQYFERLKSQLLTALAIRAQDTGDMASLAFDRLLFPGHPYGFPEDGYVESISAITREDLFNFHQKNYGPQKMVIVVVGDVKPEIVFDSFEAALGNWQNPELREQPQLPTINPISKMIKEHIHLEGKSQIDLIMGTHGPKRHAPDFLAASLGNNILGQFGMMGRIGDVVREKAGLAYYASTSVNSWIESGSWEVSAGVNPKNLNKAIKLIIKELERFCTEMVSQGELEDSQANYVGRLPLSLESNSGVANAILNIERFDLGLDYYQRYPSLINSITREQVLTAAQKYIDPTKLVVVSAGSLPVKVKKK